MPGAPSTAFAASAADNVCFQAGPQGVSRQIWDVMHCARAAQQSFDLPRLRETYGRGGAN
jgi:hypothetical protein